MQEFPNLDWYQGTLAINGYTPEEAQAGLPDLLEMFEMRPYLANAQVWLDNENNRILVRVDIQASDAKSADDMLTDFLMDMAVASIDFSAEEGISIDTLDVRVRG